MTKEAQMLLSAIYKTEQNFGKNYILDILRGSKEQKLLANGADKLSVYGIGMHLAKKEWFIILERLLELKIVHLGEFSVLKLTHEAADILRGKKELFIKSSRLEINIKEKKVKSEERLDFDAELFEKLRTKRAKLANELQVPAYIIFSDKVLKNIAASKPHDKESMLMVNGIAQKKFEQFGEAFLEVFNS
ncbi:MAG: RQC domain-containing protein [Sulfurimonas sp.]|nr:RQC domain-containing protein [Sulfurimonas sp.]